ncbi:hypothetical protein Ahy_B05g079079 isoform A [Arachis hypogaea]|uniref:Uncharacterized protein n=1 Tax=Arachis hypogaea TaxID=3818 RepID=A0A444Z8Y5_ARAHY|nr:hypothetical protein Ahy_B05g079079 isoform A [Arachis hypogaea]
MATEDSFLVLVHNKGMIKRKTRSEKKFTDKDLLSVFIRPFMSLVNFQNIVPQKLGTHGMKRIEKLYYRIPISVVRDRLKYNSFVIGSDEDLQVLFHCRRQFPKVRIPELLAKLVDVVSSSGESSRNHPSLPTVAASSSTPVIVSSSVSVITSGGDLVAFPSFAVGTNMNTPVMILISGGVGKPDAVEDVLGDEDDVEPASIADDSDDDLGRSIPVGASGASSLGTQQYPPHFLTLDLDAMRPGDYRM